MIRSTMIYSNRFCRSKQSILAVHEQGDLDLLILNKYLNSKKLMCFDDKMIFVGKAFVLQS